jgi:RNA polymerase-binding transcription factor DksA
METTMTDHSTYKAALLKRLSELDKRLHAIEAELDAPHSKDWDEAAVEHEGDEVLEGLGTSGQEEIRRIQAALERLREGAYGFCVKCGEEISDARLKVVPDAPLCSDCAAG